MRSPRRVTVAAMGMPWRRRKAAIDLRERRRAGFCPVMRPSSSMAASRILMFWVASPTPMLTTTFSRRGTAITLGYLRSLSRRGMTCFWYVSLIRALIFFLSGLPRARAGAPGSARLLLVENSRAPAAHAYAGAVAQGLGPDAGAVVALA